MEPIARNGAREAAREEAREEKIAQLLEAALSEFASAGLDGARVDAIAGAAGMNKRLLYHYVGDKAALFDASLDLAIDRVLETPAGLHAAEWRLICHGSAAGRLNRLEELATMTGSKDDNLAAAALGLRLLAGLLPELADQVLGNLSNEAADGQDGEDEKGAAGRRQAIGRVLRSLRTPAVKPRLKLRPQLRQGG